MVNRNKLLFRLASDLGAAALGLFLGGIYVVKFGGGLGQPLNTTDSLVVISTTFLFLLLSALFQKKDNSTKVNHFNETCN